MKNKISIVLRLVVAILFLQTLYFKFTGQPESVYIFKQLGAEPFGRIASGIVELIIIILLFIPRSKIIGIFLSLIIISGAIFSHLCVLGVEIMNDGGTLFYLALIIFIFSIALFFIHKDELLKTKH